MMRAICVIPARMASSRYPGKPLKPLALKSVLDRLLAAREVQSAEAPQPADVV